MFLVADRFLYLLGQGLSGSFLGSSSDPIGTVLFDTSIRFGSMPSRKSASLLFMALALIAVVFTATAIGTVFHDKY